MRVLIVCSGNAPGFAVETHQAFVYDQVEALRRLDNTLQFDYFFINRKGAIGYLSCLKKLTDQLTAHVYDWVHAHVAVSGLLANLQRRVPVITTFHGSDINVSLLSGVSLLVDLLSHRTIYISQKLVEKAIYSDARKRSVIPCGVDFSLFTPRPKQKSRQQVGLSADKLYVLFSSSFTTDVKNYPLAQAAISLLGDDKVELLELKNYTRLEVALLFSAVDVALLTSFSEGSPQFVKEALACNCPVVATDVGDVRQVMSAIPGCYLTTFDPADVADKLHLALTNSVPIASRDYIQHLDSQLIADQVRTIYQSGR